MDILTILKIVATILGAVVTSIIPIIIKLISSIKTKKSEASKNDMLNAVNEFIVTAEELYKNIDNILKTQGLSNGAVKKDTVMTKLQAYALERGYVFDAEFWSNKIDEIVALTRKVNSK